MSDTHSTTPVVADKPAKPSPDFPLFPHATGRWAKKIKGKMHYFGRWHDAEGALQQYRDFLDGNQVVKSVGVKGVTPGVNDPAKPVKPYPEFLFPHATGRWAKKIRGKMHYFGPWSDPDAALTKYMNEKDALHAGRKLRPDPTAVTVKDVANDFLNAKQALVDAGELSPRTWADYKQVCVLVVDQLGKTRIVSDVGPDDFAPLRNRMAKRWGPHRMNKLVQYTRSIFKHAYDNDTIPTPVRFGPGFNRPSKKTIRLNRAEQGTQLFLADEIRRLLEVAGTSMKAMILLGVNCGFGNADCANLPLSALDLDSGWVDYPRPKTGVNRRCPLWPETVAALRDALAKRPAPKCAADAGLVFITKYGYGWAKDIADSPITKETRKLLDALGINGHRNFYILRHTFRTVADEARDQPAADFIMGHESTHMSTVYRERISDERLKAIVDYVRTWLFAAPENDKPEQKEETTTVVAESPRCEE